MRLAALFSGGKDSAYAARLMELEGYDVQYLVSMRSKNPDSYMFHTVNIGLTELQAYAWGKEHVEAETRGVKEKELDDLKRCLKGLDVEGVVTGAIASSYQRERVDRICRELGLEHVSPLWGRERVGLLNEMLSRGMVIVFSAVAAQGLDQKWLGAKLDRQAVNRLVQLMDRYGVDPCGEGGEYESLVLDAPWFRYRIEVKEAEHSWDGVSGRYRVVEADLRPKK
ncbi:MAG TPA: diphthine--ammonia ligase [Candidatus Krumholzibacteriaceae bacterium]|nr:diphthine--ammonia ligase [Candidatus Krumholzibacteriaceae bacterium]